MRVTLFSLLFITVALSNAQTVISLNDTTYSVVTMPRRDVEEVDDGFEEHEYEGEEIKL